MPHLIDSDQSSRVNRYFILNLQVPKHEDPHRFDGFYYAYVYPNLSYKISIWENRLITL